MAAFSGTCDSKACRPSRLRRKDTKSRSSVCASPLEKSDCSTVLEKSQEFFQICDTEEKGFVTRWDMQRLLGELPLSAEELENVFDTLDADGNGYLTPDEFSSGFSEFVFGPAAASAATLPPVPERVGESVSPDMLYQSDWEDKLNVSEDDEEKHFSMLMENLGASNVFEECV